MCCRCISCLYETLLKAKLGFSDPEETRVWHGHDSTKNPLLPPQCVLMDLLQKSLHSVSLITAYASGNLATNESDTMKQPNWRQVRKGQLRAGQQQVKRQLKDTPQQKIEKQKLFDDIKQEILAISEAENHRKWQKKKHTARESFYRNPYAFAKKLFTRGKSGQLYIPKEDGLVKWYPSRFVVMASSVEQPLIWPGLD